MDFTRATSMSAEVSQSIDDAFTYQPWDEKQELAGTRVREALAAAVKVIVECVPPSADRSTAIRKVREARMDANSAITHGGKY
jgi:hypothetical protein